MDVAVIVGVVIGDPGRVVVVDEETEALEQVERAIDGRSIDRRVRLDDPAVDRLGGDVSLGRGDRVEDESTLSGDAVTSMAQRGQHLRARPGHRPPW